MISAPLTILYADDDEEDRLIFKEGVAESGVPVQLMEFHNGASLIQYLSVLDLDESSCCAIVSDMKMPGMGGTDILKVTRNNTKLSRIPVIIFSTSSSSQDQDLCYNLGALAFLSKPNSFNEVKKMAGMIVTLVRKTCNDRFES